MRPFNYSKIKEEKCDSEIPGLIAAIYKFAGKQELWSSAKTRRVGETCGDSKDSEYWGFKCDRGYCNNQYKN